MASRTTPVQLFLAAALAAQLWVSAQHPRPDASAQALPPAPAQELLRVAALGEPIALGQILTLWLQAFDNQPGISIPFLALDYDRVESWLDRLLSLDPGTQYPLLMAAHFYGQVPDLAKERQMLAFIHRRFLEDPAHRWRWLAHAVVMAKHRLKDLPLALRYAETLAAHASHASIPNWARQMRIFLLEDLGEIQAAKILLGGLLASGQITDEHEKHLLVERLSAMENGEKSSTPPNSRP
ncbi:MAG: hypothetical protein ACKVQA_25095 [Burkholderiales bacterium]